jgi:hypothetical protein
MSGARGDYQRLAESPAREAGVAGLDQDQTAEIPSH